MDNILIIDDEQQIRHLLSRMLELEGYNVLQASDCQSGFKQLEIKDPDVILCDVFLPDGNGIDLIKTLKQKCPNTEIILLTAYGNIPDGVQAIKSGAFDYITKGDDNRKIIPLIARAMAQVREKKMGITKIEGSPLYTFQSIQTQSKQMQHAVDLAQKVSTTDITVLITGETGTGKELFAQAIHTSGTRQNETFMAINCSAFSKDLLESELFGHKAGSFTGAIKDKRGLFEVADKGTLFLDEIGEMAFELQAKLLRILETGEYIKIGDTKPKKVNVRIISATNRDLKKEIELGTFREDLYYRLSVFSIHLPPLRDRREDIVPLAKEFITFFSRKFHKKVVSITPDYLSALQGAEWRGNIRELRNVIERSLVVCDQILTLSDLPLELQTIRTNKPIDRDLLEFELSQIEKRHIIRVLQHTNGNKTEAARLLKIGLTTLYRKIEDYQI